MTDTVREPTTSGYAPQYDAADSARAARAYVDEILEQDADVRARAKVSPQRQHRGRMLFLVSLPLFAILTALNVKVRSDGVEPPSPIIAEREARVGVYLAMQQVEAYRASHGLALPASLEEIGADAPGLEYRADRGKYQITARVYEATADYTLGDDTTPFEAAATRLFESGARSP